MYISRQKDEITIEITAEEFNIIGPTNVMNILKLNDPAPNLASGTTRSPYSARDILVGGGSSITGDFYNKDEASLKEGDSFILNGKEAVVGHVGPEAILPSKKTVNVIIENKENSVDIDCHQTRNSDGSLDINIILEQIKKAVADDISKGGTGLNKAFNNRYGSNPPSPIKR